MRYALIITLGVCYWLGWLPPSLVVPALMVVGALRLPAPKSGPIPRRGGYIVPPSPVSDGGNPGMVQRVRTYTSSPIPPGSQSADVRAAFKTPLGASRTTGPGSYMSEWGFAPGRLTTDADTLVVDARGNWISGGGDCGCGDTAA